MKQRHRGVNVLRWGLVLLGLVLALPSSADAQFRPKRPRRDAPGDRPSRKDPTDQRNLDEATRKKAAEYLRGMLGEGAIHGRLRSNISKSREYPSMATTTSLAPIFLSSLTMRANSPAVKPWRKGSVCGPTKDS